ncbi:hypothetical protein XENOCAPTIV_026860 [Xenoophorus captivus]|uniref:WH1 domain-containing protein n=1 Tax=Xenoophorus captivus TaxID=1517983 RepID=A0ABV0S3D3_9TELE
MSCLMTRLEEPARGHTVTCLASFICFFISAKISKAQKLQVSYFAFFTMSSGVVQVFTADRNGSWNKRCCGVACLVKDNTKRSYFIRVFDIREGKMMFEQELYSGFTDNLLRPYFITFAGDVSRPSPLWVSRFRPNLLSLAGFLTRCDSLVFCAIL